MIFKFNKVQIFLMIFFTLISCKDLNGNNEKFTVKKDSFFTKKDSKDVIETKNNKEQTLKQKNSIGVLSLKEGYNDAKIILYNRDGTIWKSFIITDSFEDNQIIPFALKSDDRLLVFQVFDVTDLFYLVKVDERKNLFKFIKKSDNSFVYELWEKHILKVFSVDFDYKLNPQRQEPDNDSKKCSYDKEQFYHPIKVKNEWLMIKDDDDNESWIKWKNNTGSLLITLYYSA